MNKLVVTILIILTMFLVACNEHATSDISAATEVVLTGTESAPLNDQMDAVLQSYLSIKELMIADDSTAARKAAMDLVGKVNAVDKTLIPEGELARWEYKQRDLLKYGLGVKEAPSLEAQRQQFELLGNTLYLVLTEIGAGSTEVYRQYCPMAFDNTGAYWLSDKQEIRNPYFGSMMLKCGSVKEILKFKKAI